MGIGFIVLLLSWADIHYSSFFPSAQSFAATCYIGAMLLAKLVAPSVRGDIETYCTGSIGDKTRVLFWFTLGSGGFSLLFYTTLGPSGPELNFVVLSFVVIAVWFSFCWQEKSGNSETEVVKKSVNEEQRLKQKLDALVNDSNISTKPQLKVSVKPSLFAPSALLTPTKQPALKKLAPKKYIPTKPISKQSTPTHVLDDWMPFDSLDETNDTSQDQSYANRINNPLQRYHVDSLWHMTHLDNIASIARSGIVSHNKAHSLYNPNDISNQSVQNYRSNIEPIFHRSLHDYAPTYFNIRNPMLYTKREINPQLCLIEICPSVIGCNQSVFSDGNAAAKQTLFYGDAATLDELPWEVIRANYWNDFEDGKRKRCSEVLIYPSIGVEFIRRVHLYNQWQLASVRSVLPSNVYVQVSPHLFF